MMEERKAQYFFPTGPHFGALSLGIAVFFHDYWFCLMASSSTFPIPNLCLLAHWTCVV